MYMIPNYKLFIDTYNFEQSLFHYFLNNNQNDLNEYVLLKNEFICISSERLFKGLLQCIIGNHTVKH